jgi:hypothetical protein
MEQRSVHEIVTIPESSAFRQPLSVIGHPCHPAATHFCKDSFHSFREWELISMQHIGMTHCGEEASSRDFGSNPEG